MLSPDASAYEAKCQRVDAETLPQICSPDDPQAEVLHIYGPLPPARVLRRIHIPYIAKSAPPPSLLPWRRSPAPAAIIDERDLPEAVERAYARTNVVPCRKSDTHRIGSFIADREGVANAVDQAHARLHRFRDDIEWYRFDSPPLPDELREMSLWVDPLFAEDDRDGFVAEAIVSGCLVVAGRSPVNVKRLDEGRAGFLVPMRDPNELVHAILNALFREEQSSSRRRAMDAAAARFAPENRVRALTDIYQRALNP